MGRRSRKRGEPRPGGEHSPEGTGDAPSGSSRAERDAARARRARALARGEEVASSRAKPAGARRARSEDRPPAPWGSFPLTEITALLALAFLVGSFFVEGPRAPTMFLAAMVLGSLVGVELALREHLTGFRSHTTLLAGVPGVIAMVGGGYALGLSGTPGPLTVALGVLAGALVFALCFVGLRRAFRRRSGGLSVRF